MRRALSCSVGLGAVLLLGCGGEVAVYCARGDDGCRCSIETFALERDEVAVEACDAPIAVEAGGCCHDLDVTGTSTYCQCVEYVCYRSGTDCHCGVFDVPEGAERVESCAVDDTYDQCCWGTGYSCTCQDRGGGTPFMCALGTGLVDACPSAATYLEGHCNAQIASSCAGLDWPDEPSGVDVLWPF